MTVTIENPHSLATDAHFAVLKDYLIAGTGLSYYCRRDAELADHIARHLRKLAIKNCSTYLQLLKNGADGEKELDALIEDLTIGETFFFRHTDLFTAMEQSILPDIIERNKTQRRLRIWSAGSSIGAEAYTMSILLRRQFAHLLRGWQVTIIGTDINRSFLSRATQAQYEKWTLRGISDEIKQECFSCHGKIWTLRPEFKEGVSFQYHNLAMNPFPSLTHNLFDFDVILCRNVMIYFNQQVIENIVSKMRDCLVDGGWFLVGHAEHNLELFRDYRTVPFSGATGYQRVDQRDAPWAGLPERTSVFPRLSKQAITLPSQPRAMKPQLLTFADTMCEQEKLADELANIRVLADRGEVERAEVKCQELLKTHKLDPICHLYHALVLGQLDQHSSCEKALRRALYLDRDFILAHYHLGLTLQRLGRQAEATRFLHNARRLLGTLDCDSVIEDSDGLTVVELDKLARMHLDALES